MQTVCMALRVVCSDDAMPDYSTEDFPVNPKLSILNPQFRYYNSAKTNVARTIKREQARLKALAESKVVQLRKAK